MRANASTILLVFVVLLGCEKSPKKVGPASPVPQDVASLKDVSVRKLVFRGDTLFVWDNNGAIFEVIGPRLIEVARGRISDVVADADFLYWSIAGTRKITRLDKNAQSVELTGGGSLALHGERLIYTFPQLTIADRDGANARELTIHRPPEALLLDLRRLGVLVTDADKRELTNLITAGEIAFDGRDVYWSALNDDVGLVRLDVERQTATTIQGAWLIGVPPATSGGDVYWVQKAKGLMRFRGGEYDGGARVVDMLGGCCRAFAVDDRSIFWFDGHGIVQQPKDGGSSKQMVQQSDVYVVGSNGRTLYWVADNTLRSLPL